MLKRVHVAGVLALGLSGAAAAQTTINPASLIPDQIPPEAGATAGTAERQPGGTFLSSNVLGTTLTGHLAGAALLLHQEAALWPGVLQPVTVVAPLPDLSVEEVASATEPASTAAAVTDTAPALASTAELVPLDAAPVTASFNEDTTATVSAFTTTLNTAPNTAPTATSTLADLNLPALPSAALTGQIVDLALAPAPATQAGSQLARLRLLQAQNPRRPSAAQSAVQTTTAQAEATVQATTVQTATVQATAPIRRAAVVAAPKMPTPQDEVTGASAASVEAAPARNSAPVKAATIKVEPVRAAPAAVRSAAVKPIVVVDVRVPAVSRPVRASPIKTPVAPVVTTAAPVRMQRSAPAAIKPAAVKTAPVKPAPVKPAAVKPAIIKAVPVARPAPVQAAPTVRAPVIRNSNTPVVGGTRNSTLGRPQSRGYSRVVSATAYSSDVAQTDSTPFVTATGTRVRPGVIALSRDLLRVFPYGSRVTIRDSAGILSGRVFIVEDTMAARMRNTIDVWVGSRRQAYQWGRRTVTITAVR